MNQNSVNSMPVVTITSDIGPADYYLAALKGAILRHCGIVSIIDINVAVPKFDLKQAVFSLQQAFNYFPDHTVHLAHINPNYITKRILIAPFRNQFFISFDNGFLSLLFNQNQVEFFAVKQEFISKEGLNHFHDFAFLANHLIHKKPIAAIADYTDSIVFAKLPEPVAGSGGIKGQILSIDAFGNGITNITKAVFQETVGNKNFTLSVNHEKIYSVSNSYSDVNEGDFLCFFNDAGLLEIAMNRGKASNLLGLSVSQSVIITF